MSTRKRQAMANSLRTLVQEKIESLRAQGNTMIFNIIDNPDRVSSFEYTRDQQTGEIVAVTINLNGILVAASERQVTPVSHMLHLIDHTSGIAVKPQLGPNLGYSLLA